MKTLVKFFIAVLLLISCQPVFCQKLPPFANWYQGTINEYPVYKDYFEEYTSRLYDNLKIKENFPWYTILGVNYKFTLHKNGNISDFKMYYTFSEDIEYTNKYLHPLTYYGLANYSKEYEEYVKKVIMENPPKPFPKDIEYEEMDVTVEILKKNKSEQRYWLKEFNSYYNVNCDKAVLCAFDMSGANTYIYNNNNKKIFVPPKWHIAIFYFN